MDTETTSDPITGDKYKSLVCEECKRLKILVLFYYPEYKHWGLAYTSPHGSENVFTHEQLLHIGTHVQEIDKELQHGSHA